MASLHSIPRFLLPRGPLLLRTRASPIPALLPLSAFRHASSLPQRPKTLAEQLQNNKPRVIPQPDRYRPPSHGKRTPRSETQQKSYGPGLSEEDRIRMATKKYPNMMSPPGTFSHWFLNNRSIHVWITMGVLFSLAIAAWYIDFVNKTIYYELLPGKKDYVRHPFESCNRFIEVYKMHMEYTSREVEKRRLKKYEDVEKRKQFRLDRKREAEERGEEYEEDPRYYIDEFGVRRRRVKRWFGIWE